MESPSYQPDGYHSLTPYLHIKDPGGFIAFLQKVFEAKENISIAGPDGSLMHAEFQIGDSRLMLSDACSELGPSPASLYVYLPDVDQSFKRAVEAGAEATMEPSNMFWGDRHGCVKDPWGNRWSLAAQVEKVSPEELQYRASAFAADLAKKAMAGPEKATGWPQPDPSWFSFQIPLMSPRPFGYNPVCLLATQLRR